MPEPQPVRLGALRGTAAPAWHAALHRLAPDVLARSDGPGLLALGAAVAEDLVDVLACPGEGRTLEAWECLATLGATDLTVARVVEPHLDAVSILRQARRDATDRPGGLLGVYAAEGPGHRLVAVRARGEDAWLLSGSKPWCSLAAHVGGFLITAFVDDAERGLFLVDRQAATGVSISSADWVARGLTAVDSPVVELDSVPAIAVGGPGWYLRRPGFAWGGMGVAAVWHGGAVAVARRLHEQGRRRELDQIGRMHLGRVDAALHRSRAVLAEAAALVDRGAGDGGDGARLALRVRNSARLAAEETLMAAAHGLGPGPLTGEERHARRVADLQVYLRQEHAARDEAALGALIDVDGPAPW